MHCTKETCNINDDCATANQNCFSIEENEAAKWHKGWRWRMANCNQR